MKTAETEDATTSAARETFLRFPGGLLGFEPIKEFVLVSDPDEAPFSWLKSVEDPALAFVVLPPFAVAADYQPDIPAEDVAFLGLAGPEDALVLNIVTLRAKGRATINLKGPLVINRHTLVGKQVVLANASEYSVQHPLPVAGGKVLC